MRLLEHVAALDVTAEVLRIDADRCIGIGERPVELALAHECAGAVVEGRGILRIERDRLAEIRDRGIELAILVVNEAAPVVCGRIFRVDLDRLVVVRKRPRLVVLAGVGAAAFEIPAGKARAEGESAILLGDGEIVVLALVVDHAAPAVGRRELGVDRDRRIAVLERLVERALAAIDVLLRARDVQAGKVGSAPLPACDRVCAGAEPALATSLCVVAEIPVVGGSGVDQRREQHWQRK